MTSEPLFTAEALKYALDKASAFARVNASRSYAEKVEAIDVWFEAVGLSEDKFEMVDNWMVDEGVHDYAGEILLGLMIGLFINEINHG